MIGSGPIVIGQACEFDYSGTQACKVLRARWFRGVPGELEPRDDHDRSAVRRPDVHRAARPRVGARGRSSARRPDALLPTLGGQTGLNVAVALAESGDLDRLGVRLIGATLEAIHRAEDRSAFQQAMLEAGLEVPRAGDRAHPGRGARPSGDAIGYPVIVRAVVHARWRGQRLRSTARGARGAGRGAAWRPARSARSSSRSRSPAGRSSSSRSCATATTTRVIVCSIENVDPMGVHTGDSITVAPQQTLTDAEYQRMRDAALRCSARSASRPAAPTCSSRSIRATAGRS